jgi:TldD protein
MFDSSALLRQRLPRCAARPKCSLRHVKQSHQSLSVRRNVAEPPHFSQDEGAMLTVRVNGVEAYAATADLSQSGLQRALEQAEALARRSSPTACSTSAATPQRAPRPRFAQLRPALPSLADCLACWPPNPPACPRTAAWWTGRPASASAWSSRPT